jgi:hypothetical protein
MYFENLKHGKDPEDMITDNQFDQINVRLTLSAALSGFRLATMAMYYCIYTVIDNRESPPNLRVGINTSVCTPQHALLAVQ